ncbi:uncharacterized membrane protein YidH (DUF202 family) [Alkalibacillus filiformis]|uniref:Uncharacterized membrane protein YidH (DUF202 family) n=1 Tax=Alkalibacillus filiformis TaxID=200990 RepID=A0ABU0DPS3_9BACI|nr:DUF4190 domain-containing protein [Alkalibacillus filiformis]MDQ0350306.1 uncharacterized membrane protein YidH (DUF202 family) [Alkalibacillus filiformis]
MEDQDAKNSYSTTSLTLGILSILVPLIGFVLGVVGVITSKKAQKAYEKKDGLATSGMVCSIIGIVIQLFAILNLISYFSISVN